MASVHQIIVQSGDKYGHPPFVITTRCGETRRRKHGTDPLDADLSLWDSRVTCGACKAVTEWPPIGKP